MRINKKGKYNNLQIDHNQMGESFTATIKKINPISTATNTGVQLQDFKINRVITPDPELYDTLKEITNNNQILSVWISNKQIGEIIQGQRYQFTSIHAEQKEYVEVMYDIVQIPNQEVTPVTTVDNYDRYNDDLDLMSEFKPTREGMQKSIELAQNAIYAMQRILNGGLK